MAGLGPAIHVFLVRASQDVDGRPQGVEAVVDKDLAAVVLARAVGADILLLLTDVDRVYTAFGTPDAHGLDELTVEQARSLVHGPELAAGSMLPKVDACAEFAGSGGIAIIAALDHASDAIRGTAGTRVVPSSVPVAASTA